MINNNEILWSVLIKYDGLDEFNSFCNGISNFIQKKQSGDDIINIFQGLSKVDMSDRTKIDNTIGSDIDSLLFSM